MTKTWRKEDITYAKRYASKRKLDELSSRFGADPQQVQTFLTEHKLKSKDGFGFLEPWRDPAFDDFESGLEAFHGGRLAAARKLFDKVISECDQPELRQRSRTYLALCDHPAGAGSGGAPEDAYLEALAARNNGDFATALSMCAAGGRRAKDERFAYLAAAVNALSGSADDAFELLGVAIELNPENRVHAFHDSDFEALHADERFAALFED